MIDAMTQLKLALLSRGVRADDATHRVLAEEAKPALRVRSGSCGGLDLVLPDGTYVNCPIEEAFARRDGIDLRHVGERFVLDWEGDPVEVAPLPVPAYYRALDSHGHPLTRSGQICFDRLGIGITNNCTYWRDPDSRCQFCSIGLNTRAEGVHKRHECVREAVSAAFDDAVLPATHTLIGGGTPDQPDSGIREIATLTREVKGVTSAPVYVMITPPPDLGLLDQLVEAGVDEIGINLELFSESHARFLLRAKRERHGLAGYLAALERSVELFGPVATRSILVVGLEPIESTVQGVELLASMGVMPILSPFRPLTGTALEERPPPEPTFLADVLLAATEAAARHGVPLGPTCLACQGNALTVPGHPSYRWYGNPIGVHP